MRRVIVLRRRSVAARDSFSTVLDLSVALVTPPAKMTMGISAMETAKRSRSLSVSETTKRTRPALQAIHANDDLLEMGGSAEPPRKASRGLMSSIWADRENVPEAVESQRSTACRNGSAYIAVESPARALVRCRLLC